MVEGRRHRYGQLGTRRRMHAPAARQKTSSHLSLADSEERRRKGAEHRAQSAELSSRARPPACLHISDIYIWGTIPCNVQYTHTYRYIHTIHIHARTALHAYMAASRTKHYSIG